LREIPDNGFTSHLPVAPSHRHNATDKSPVHDAEPNSIILPSPNRKTTHLNRTLDVVLSLRGNNIRSLHTSTTTTTTDFHIDRQLIIHQHLKQLTLRLLPTPHSLQDTPGTAELVADGHDTVVRDGAGDVMVQLEGVLDGEEVALPYFFLQCS